MTKDEEKDEEKQQILTSQESETENVLYLCIKCDLNDSSMIKVVTDSFCVD